MHDNEPYCDRNFWFSDGSPKYPCVRACRNQIVLIDLHMLRDAVKREEAKATDLSRTSKSYSWAVYDASRTKYFGEWLAHKTKKRAIADFIRRSGLTWKDSKNDCSFDPAVDKELKRHEALLNQQTTK